MNVIQVKELVKRYGEVVALDHFDLEVKAGEILGLLGPNGCGKTTAIHCMLNLLTFQGGDIRLFGDVNTRTAWKKQVGIVPQELAYFENLTVQENIDFFCGLYVEDKTLRKQYVEDAIRFVRLEEYRKFFPKKLSGGLKRRLNIACGIAHQPQLIFMDEPTVAVDAQSRQFILEGIKALNAAGKTIVYTTHYLDEADYLCDRIVIMDKGRHVVSGTPTELRNQVSTQEVIQLELLDEPSEMLKTQFAQLAHLQQVHYDKQVCTLSFSQVGYHLATIAMLLQEHQQTYLALNSKKPSLNEVFLAFTGKELRD
ncbi:MAG: ABC transporter ATP-binding protein [Aerococcaceae bacterium]|nr:ABC transporter ATP-binding protein [Aerococcaceae bacterium]